MTKVFNIHPFVLALSEKFPEAYGATLCFGKDALTDCSDGSKQGRPYFMELRCDDKKGKTTRKYLGGCSIPRLFDEDGKEVKWAIKFKCPDDVDYHFALRINMVSTYDQKREAIYNEHLFQKLGPKALGVVLREGREALERDPEIFEIFSEPMII